MNRKPWRWAASATDALALVTGVAAQLAHVHAETGYWGLSVSATKAPSRVQYERRYYDQGDQVKVPSTP